MALASGSGPSTSTHFLRPCVTAPLCHAARRGGSRSYIGEGLQVLEAPSQRHICLKLERPIVSEKGAFSCLKGAFGGGKSPT